MSLQPFTDFDADDLELEVEVAAEVVVTSFDSLETLLDEIKTALTSLDQRLSAIEDRKNAGDSLEDEFIESLVDRLSVTSTTDSTIEYY